MTSRILWDTGSSIPDCAISVMIAQVTTRIFWDTRLFFYWITAHPDHVGGIEETLTRIESRGDRLCASAFGLGELLVGVAERGGHREADRIRRIVRPPHVELLAFDAAAAERYVAIRRTHGTSAPDSIQLASAAAAGVDLFMTAEAKLKRIHVPGIKFVVGIDTPVL